MVDVFIQNVLVVTILIAICLLADAAIVLITKILPRRIPTYVKTQRFEAGNPPVGVPKYLLPMQYIGFLFIFLVCEPILVLFLLLASDPGASLLLVLGFLLLLPALYVSYRYASEISMGGKWVSR
jgi:NADH-quinone oxidoreductase subunit A